MNKKSNFDSIPVSWSEAKINFRETAEYGLNIFKEEVEELLAVKPSVTIAPEFATFPTLLMRVAVTLGPDPCIASIRQMGALFARTKDEFSKSISKHNRISAIGVLNFVNLARCCGEKVDFSDQEMMEFLAKLLSYKGVFTEFECETLALASLAYRQSDWALAYLDDEADKDFIAGRVFGPNVHGMILYLHSAQQHQAKAPEIEPAWKDFLLAFPRKLAAKTLTWSDLAWAARIYYCNFLKLDISEVIPSLHKQVRELMK